MLLVAILAACGGETSSVTTESATTSASDNTDEMTSTTAPTITTSTTDGATTTTSGEEGPTILVIFLAGSEVRGGGFLPVTQGDEVRLEVTADVTDEVHLHGYDLSAPVSPGVTAIIEFTADIPGIFEIELEESGLALADLFVAP